MKPEVGFDTFEVAEKLEIVYGRIVEVEEIPKSDKLLKLLVFFGEEYGNKTILSAIKEQVDDPQSIKGNAYFFILNFSPRKIMGILSEGMILPFSLPGESFSGSLRNSQPSLSIGTKLF